MSVSWRQGDAHDAKLLNYLPSRRCFLSRVTCCVIFPYPVNFDRKSDQNRSDPSMPIEIKMRLEASMSGEFRELTAIRRRKVLTTKRCHWLTTTLDTFEENSLTHLLHSTSGHRPKLLWWNTKKFFRTEKISTKIFTLRREMASCWLFELPFRVLVTAF